MGVLTDRIWLMVITKDEMKGRKAEGAKFLDSLMPRYTDVVSKVGIAEDPLITVGEVIDFRKLELYASLFIEHDAGRKSYLARFGERARGRPYGARCTLAISFFPYRNYFTRFAGTT